MALTKKRTKVQSKVTEYGEIDLKSLVKALALVKPSVVDGQNFLPILSHYCFKDGFVFGYDDVLSIAASYGSSYLDGLSIPTTVVDAFKASSSAMLKVDQSSDDGILELKLGRARIKFAPILEEGFLFIPPPVVVPKIKASILVQIPLSEKLMSGINLCLSNLTAESYITNQKGILVIVKGSTVCLYSTDNITVSKYVVKYKTRVAEDAMFLIPRKSCIALAQVIGSDASGAILHMYKKALWCTPGDNLSVYSKLIPLEGVHDPEATVFSKYEVLDKDFLGRSFVRKLSSVLDRAIALLKGSKQFAQDVRIQHKEDKIVVSLTDNVEGAMFSGKFSESIKVSSAVGTFDFKFNAPVLKRACELCSDVAMSGTGVFVFTAEDFKHIVSSS